MESNCSIRYPDGLLTQHIQADCLVDAALQCLVGALASVDHTVHFLGDV